MTNEIKLKITIDNKEAIGSLQLTDENVQELYRSFKYGKQEVNGFTTAISQGFNNARQIIQGFHEVYRTFSTLFAEQLKNYQEQEAANIQLAQALKQNGNYTEENYKSLLDYSSQLQQTTIYGDELTTTVMAQLQAMGLNVEQTKMATLQSANLAAIMGTDLNTAARGMADLFNGNIGMIGRYIKGLDETVIKSGDLNAIMMMLNERIGGQAEAIGNTSLGAMAKYNNALGDIKENVGKLISQGLEPLATALSNFLNDLNSANPELTGIVGLLGTTTAAFVTLRVTGILPAITSFKILGVTITGFKATLISTGIGAAIVALGYGLTQLAEAYNKFQNAKANQQQTINIFKNEVIKDAAGKTKAEIEQMIKDSESSIDSLNKKINDLGIEHNKKLTIQENRDKEGNVYKLEYETEVSKKIQENINSEKQRIQVEKERIDALKTALTELNKQPKTPGGTSGSTNDLFEQQKKELMLSEQHKINIAEIEGKSEKEIIKMKIEYFYKMLALYEKFKKDSTELTYQTLEEEARLNKLMQKYPETKTPEQIAETIQPKGVEKVKDEREIGDITKYQRISGEREIELWAEKEKAKVGIYKNADELRKAIDEEALRRKEEFAETEKRIEEEKEQAKIHAAIGSLNYIGQSVAEHTLLGKTAAVAQATMNTYEAATKALTAGPILGPILAGIITALGLATVAKIMAIEPPKATAYAEGGMAIVGEKGPEIIAPAKDYAEGQALLVSEVVKQLSNTVYMPINQPLNNTSNNQNFEQFANGLLNKLDNWKDKLEFKISRGDLYTTWDDENKFRNRNRI